MQITCREDTMPTNSGSIPKVQKSPRGRRWDFRVCAAPDCDERVYRFMDRWGRKYHSDECQRTTAKLRQEQRKREQWDKQSELDKAKKTLH